jgi:transposase InsO family protein
MRENKLRALHGYRIRRWSVGKPAVLIANLLQRQFTVTRPNKAWVTGITCIRTWQGWLYLAVIMDLFSRMIVGWSVGPTIHRELVLNAVLMAVRRRRPHPHGESFGSRHPVRQRRVAALLPLQPPGAEHEPQGKLLGQCPGLRGLLTVPMEFLVGHRTEPIRRAATSSYVVTS